MRRVGLVAVASVALGSLFLASAAEAANRRGGRAASMLANRTLPASPVTIRIDKTWAKSNCDFYAAGGTSAQGSCSNNASVKVSTASTTTPTSSTTSFTQINSASSSTKASATGPGSVASGGGSSSAGTLSARLRIR